MRLALVCTALLLFTGVRAHADTIVGVELPHVASVLPTSDSAETSDVTSSPQVVLSDEAGTDLAVGVSSSASVTPEPASVVLMGSGLLLVGGLAWRRRAAAARPAQAARLASAV